MTSAPPRSCRHRALATLGIALTVQGIAIALYFAVERSRQDDRDATFQYERVSGVPALPQLALEQSDGNVRRLSKSSRPLLLHFWATWCPPCREELPGLLRLGRETQELDVVAVSLDDDWNVIRGFFNGTIPSEVVRDADGILTKTYEVGALPDTYLFDHNGVATARFGGARDWESSGAHAALVALTGGVGRVRE